MISFVLMLRNFLFVYFLGLTHYKYFLRASITKIYLNTVEINLSCSNNNNSAFWTVIFNDTFKPLKFYRSNLRLNVTNNTKIQCKLAETNTVNNFHVIINHTLSSQVVTSDAGSINKTNKTNLIDKKIKLNAPIEIKKYTSEDDFFSLYVALIIISLSTFLVFIFHLVLKYIYD